MVMDSDKAAMEIEQKLAARFGGGLPQQPEPQKVKASLPAPSREAPADVAEPELATDATEGEPQPDVAEVEWDGTKYSIPAPLRDAFEKASDYTRKTSELAEQRRAVEHSREMLMKAALDGDFQKSIADENRELAVIDAYLQQAAKLNWTGMSTDQMMRQRIEVDQVRDRRAELMKAVEDKREQFHSKMTETLSQLRARARDIAAKSIPNYSEETEKGIKQFAMSEGLSESEVDSVLLDPRSARILWKASQYDKVKAGTAKAVTQAARAVRPGAASERMPQDVRDKLDFRKDMQRAKTSREREKLIEDRLAHNSVFNRGR